MTGGCNGDGGGGGTKGEGGEISGGAGFSCIAPAVSSEPTTSSEMLTAAPRLMPTYCILCMTVSDNRLMSPFLLGAGAAPTEAVCRAPVAIQSLAKLVIKRLASSVCTLAPASLSVSVRIAEFSPLKVRSNGIEGLL